LFTFFWACCHGHAFANAIYSRSALKKYILANNANVSPGATFDNQFNRAIKAGVDKQEFAQPKGMSTVLLDSLPQLRMAG